MKILKFLSIAIFAICLASCGGNKTSSEGTESQETIIKPVETSVSGDMSGCFKVVDRNYKAIGDFGKVVTIELERTEEALPFDLKGRELWGFGNYGSSAAVAVGFGIEFLDEDGNVLDKHSANRGGYDSDEAVQLCKLKSGDKASIRFSVYDDAESAVGFRISSAYEEQEASVISDSDSDSDSSDILSDEEEGDTSSEITETDSSSEDWDAVLDEYDRFVTKYVSLLKKAQNGDMAALTEYPDLLEQAQSLSEKLDNARGELSSTQLSRYMKILAKMTEVAF